MGLFDFIKGKNNAQQTTSTTSNFNNTNIKNLVDRCIDLEVDGRIPELQNCLFELYNNFNKPGSGKLILNYKEKDNLATCFAFMLRYDWTNDSDFLEVCAENGFYCIMEHIDHQTGGRQGQAEAMIILFTLLCAGRDSLKPKVQDIINKGRMVGNPVFHADDYQIGAQNVIDQISFLAVNGMRDLGPAATPIVAKICEKYNGTRFFQNTIQRTDLMKYSPMDVINKARFIRDVVGSILGDM